MEKENQKNEHRFTCNQSFQDEKIIEQACRFDDAGNPNCDQNSFQSITIRPGLHIYTTKVDPKLIPSYHFDISNMPLGFSFQLSGKTEITWQKSRKTQSSSIISQKGSNSLCCLDQTWGRSQHLSQEILNLVILFLDQDVLKDLLVQEWEKIPTSCHRLLEPPFFVPFSMTPGMYVVASQALCHPYQGVAARLHLESCALSLLAMQIDQITKNDFFYEKSLNRADEERIRAAADILSQNMSDPPTIVALSRRVGINETKLKRGFKKIFGQTTFEFILYQRMVWARELLISQDMDVSQTAFAVGYSNISHFIGCYKRIFGVTPGCDKCTKIL